MNRAPRLLLLSGVLALISLGLPWRPSGLDPTFRTSWLSGFCGAPGEYVCDPGTIVFHNGFTVTGAVPGYASPMRFALLVALVLLIAGFRRRSAALLQAGLAVAATGLVLGGTSVGAGQLTYLGALVVLVLALRRGGRLRFSIAAGTGSRAGGRGVDRPAQGRSTFAGGAPVEEGAGLDVRTGVGGPVSG